VIRLFILSQLWIPRYFVADNAALSSKSSVELSSRSTPSVEAAAASKSISSVKADILQTKSKSHATMYETYIFIIQAILTIFGLINLTLAVRSFFQKPQTMSVVLLRQGARMPLKHSHLETGFDVFSCADFQIQPDTVVKVPLGIAVKLPPGTYIQIQSRSSVVFNYAVDVLGGVVDNSYRFELFAIMHNFSKYTQKFTQSQKICQLVVLPVLSIRTQEVEEIEPHELRVGGFGSSGR